MKRKRKDLVHLFIVTMDEEHLDSFVNFICDNFLTIRDGDTHVYYNYLIKLMVHLDVELKDLKKVNEIALNKNIDLIEKRTQIQKIFKNIGKDIFMKKVIDACYRSGMVFFLPQNNYDENESDEPLSPTNDEDESDEPVSRTNDDDEKKHRLRYSECAKETYRKIVSNCARKKGISLINYDDGIDTVSKLLFNVAETLYCEKRLDHFISSIDDYISDKSKRNIQELKNKSKLIMDVQSNYSLFSFYILTNMEWFHHTKIGYVVHTCLNALAFNIDKWGIINKLSSFVRKECKSLIENCNYYIEDTQNLYHEICSYMKNGKEWLDVLLEKHEKDDNENAFYYNLDLKIEKLSEVDYVFSTVHERVINSKIDGYWRK